MSFCFGLVCKIHDDGFISWEVVVPMRAHCTKNAPLLCGYDADEMRGSVGRMFEYIGLVKQSQHGQQRS